MTTDATPQDVGATAGDAAADDAEVAVDATDAGVDATKVVVAVCLSIIIMERPSFAPGSAKLMPESKPVIDAAAEVMKAHPEIEEVTITGHCDTVEKPCPDEARAKAVRDAMVIRGVEPARLTTAKAGTSEPLADNATDDGRRKNRRAEWKVTRKKP